VSFADAEDNACAGNMADNPIPADVKAVRLINFLRFILRVICKIMSNHAHGILKFTNLTYEQILILFLISIYSTYLII